MKTINFTKEEKENLLQFLESLTLPNIGEMRKLDKCIVQLEDKEMEDEYYDYLKSKIETPPQGVAFPSNANARKMWLGISDKLK